MTIMKKGLSLLLCLVMLLSTVPVTRAQAANESDASVDSGAVTVAGTNSVGNLLSRELQAYQEADEAAGGYNVVGLTVENSIATAQFRTLEPAILVVALYTEDGLQLVTSGKAEVQPEETEISIVLENVPEYFTAKAYLVDTYDFSPLCTAYESVMYTQEMQELLASTVDDYDPALVLNMDSSTNTNFAVYDDTVILLEESEGTNTVVSVDDEKAEYIIDNIDSRIKSLSAGNVFALTYGDGEIIIAKVASISITGTTATIIGDDVDLEEVFSHIKISGACTSDDVENAENLSTEEVSFEGIETEHSTKANNGNDKFLKFHIRATEKDGATSVVVDAVVKLNIDVIFDYYVTLKKQHLEFKINKAVETSISVTGRLTKTVDLTKVPLEFSPVAGVYIRLQPQMIFRVSAKKSSDDRIVLKAASTEGFSFENGKGFKNLGTTPLVDVDLGETDYSFFVGVDLRPSVVVLTKKFISLEFSAILGFDIQPEQTGCAYVNNTTDIKHACENCINIEVFFKFTFAIKLKFLDSDRLSFSYFLLEPSPIKLLNMYWSLTQSKFGFGECPYKQYKTSINVKTSDGTVLTGAQVISADGQVWGTTNSNGVVIQYLSPGEYTIQASHGEQTEQTTLNVTAPMGITIYLGGKPSSSIPENPDDLMVLENAISTVYNGNGYIMINTPMSWTEAENYCERLGGHLLTVNSTEENTYIKQWLTSTASKNCYWIGLYRENVNQSWKWVTGEAVTITNWAANEPNNNDNEGEHVVHLFGKKYTQGKGIKYVGDWNDSSNTGAGYAAEFYALKNFGFICEFDQDTSFNTVKDRVKLKNGSTLINQTKDAPATRMIYGGEYGTETTDGKTLKTASFDHLVPGEAYLLLVLKSLETDDLLAENNLIHISQKTADETGLLEFEYKQGSSNPVSYVMACGASNKNLEDAQITFPEIRETETEKVIEPVVAYDGAVLTEGVDYVLVGTVSYTEAGTFTCGIRGINDYTGFVECSYTVEGIEKFDIDVARMIMGSSLEFQFGVKKSRFTTTEGYYAVIEKTRANSSTTQKTIPADQWGVEGQYYAIVYDGLCAKEMGDTFYVTIYNADGVAVSNAREDSVRAYVSRAFSGQNSKGKTMMVDMLNYGAAAQGYFNYGTDDLANSHLTDAQKACGTQTAPSMVDSAVKGQNCSGSRFIFTSRIQVQVGFKNLTEDMYAIYTYTNQKGEQKTVRVEGADFVENSKGAKIGVELSELVYSDARTLVEVTVYKADGTVHGTARDSIESCAARSEDHPIFSALVAFADSARAKLYG